MYHMRHWSICWQSRSTTSRLGPNSLLRHRRDSTTCSTASTQLRVMDFKLSASAAKQHCCMTQQFGLAVTSARGLLVGETGEEREATALTLELVPFHTQGRGWEITKVGGRTGEFSETGRVSDGVLGLTEAESCTNCGTAECETAEAECMWNWNRANKMSNFWSKAETVCCRRSN